MINKKHDLYYTSIEQSKRLLELGLNPETADMHHSKYTKIDNIDYVGLGYSELDKEEYGDVFLPCWSLGALFDVMPKIQEFDYSSLYKNHFGEKEKNVDVYYPSLCKDSFGVNVCMYSTQEHDILKIYTGKDFIEAAFYMVVWLLEKNYIDKIKNG